MIVELVARWFLFVKLVAVRFFSTWSLYIDSSPSETDFIQGTCCVLIFVLENSCVLSIVRETCCVVIFILFKLILSRNFVACRFFVRETCCMSFFSSWNLYIDLSNRETDFVHGACCVLIFVRGTFCVPIFVRETWCMLIFFFWNWCIDFSRRETDFVNKIVECWLLFVILNWSWYFSS